MPSRRAYSELEQQLEVAQALELRREAAHVEQIGQLQAEIAALRMRGDQAEEKLAVESERIERMYTVEAELAAEVEAHTKCRMQFAQHKAATGKEHGQLELLHEQLRERSGQLAKTQGILFDVQKDMAVCKKDRDAIKAASEATVATLQDQGEHLREQTHTLAEQLAGMEAQRGELQALGIAQHQILETREAELLHARQLHTQTFARLQAVEATCAELSAKQEESARRHAEAVESEKRAAAEHEENERRAARIELLLEEMHGRIELKEARDGAYADASDLRERVERLETELRAARDELARTRAEAARRENEAHATHATLHAQLRRATARNTELQTNVTLITQVNELDRLVTMLAPPRRPASASAKRGVKERAALADAATGTGDAMAKARRALEYKGERFGAELQSASAGWVSAQARQGGAQGPGGGRLTRPGSASGSAPRLKMS